LRSYLEHICHGNSKATIDKRAASPKKRLSKDNKPGSNIDDFTANSGEAVVFDVNTGTAKKYKVDKTWDNLVARVESIR